MKLILALMMSLVGLLGCLIAAQTANLGKEILLKKNEEAEIKNTNLRLKMLSAGQAQREEGGDVPFCKFEIKFNGKTKEMTLSVGNKTTVKNLNIELTGVDTTADSKAEDPWSNTSCKFIVTKSK